MNTPSFTQELTLEEFLHKTTLDLYDDETVDLIKKDFSRYTFSQYGAFVMANLEPVSVFSFISGDDIQGGTILLKHGIGTNYRSGEFMYIDGDTLYSEIRTFLNL